MPAWPDEVVGFWFALAPEQWWETHPDLDREVRARFLGLWDEQRQCPVSEFLDDAETALAAIILFDQFPRNMFRGNADSFATDHIALAIARQAVERGYDERYRQPRRGFFYMPFQHSEKLEDQQQSMLLFAALGDENQLHYARRHHDVIERFGRFPHRNDILGRAPRADELEAEDVDPTKP